MLQAFIQQVPGCSNLWQKKKRTTLIIRGFTQSFHHIPVQYLHFGHDRFLPNPFQFIIHLQSSSLKDSDDGISLTDYCLRLKIHGVSGAELSLLSRMTGRGETYCGRPCIIRQFRSSRRYSLFWPEPMRNVQKSATSGCYHPAFRRPKPGAPTSLYIWTNINTTLNHPVGAGPYSSTAPRTWVFPSRCDPHILDYTNTVEHNSIFKLFSI